MANTFSGSQNLSIFNFTFITDADSVAATKAPKGNTKMRETLCCRTGCGQASITTALEKCIL